MKTIVVKGEGLTIDDVCDVAQGNAQVRLCDEKAFLDDFGGGGGAVRFQSG